MEPRTAVEAQYTVMGHNYRRAAMDARITGNPNIGRKNQGAIDRFPDSSHLIACGDAHILHNPLQNFVHLPENVAGIVDAC
ncbi:hypothetical protein [Pseudomonas sp. TH31]|uniref:hypothetical protein n=1 Tax=Pseudomonas sp. TH31 TaxID=2796396 RepID=UPI0019121F92|nr:hypothetical protein [Pseudomonas sp. TH31]MBK5417404.1 hypothetical protein [Pseudomonas sp. TH31]